MAKLFLYFIERMIFIKQVKILLTSNNFKLNVYGFLNNNEIIFIHNNINYKFDIDTLLFVRINDEFTSFLDFNNKESIYYLNSLKEQSKIISKIILRTLLIVGFIHFLN